MPFLPRLLGRMVALAALALLVSCQSGNRSTRSPTASVQGQEYLRRAVRQSAEGLIIVPSKPAQHVFHRQRLLEVAQQLRQPAALCFVQRAAKTLRLGEVDGERVYVDVPSGQIKIRTRIQPSGEVAHTEVLESGFQDKEMEPCLQRAIEAKKFPIERDGMSHHVDIIYWVSLGMHSALESKEFRLHMRKEVARAAVRSKPCFSRESSPGAYRVEGLNLFGRDGSTLATRISKGELSPEVGDCLAVSFQGLRIPKAPDSFVRPWFFTTNFTVSKDAKVTIEDEEWLRLITLEEKLEREEKRRALLEEQGKSPAPLSPASTAPASTSTVRSGNSSRSIGEQSIIPSESNKPPADPDLPSQGSSSRNKTLGGDSRDSGSVTPDRKRGADEEPPLKPESEGPPQSESPRPQDPSAPGLKINLVPRQDPK